ncbi:MAG: hypothetical protein KAU50_00965, partial [Candidatus Marinimicrobia bacterium]|nr:hypothetical protein [Candidatus Neomarinimicrobiota bacterium]
IVSRHKDIHKLIGGDYKKMLDFHQNFPVFPGHHIAASHSDEIPGDSIGRTGAQNDRAELRPGIGLSGYALPIADIEDQKGNR